MSISQCYEPWIVGAAFATVAKSIADREIKKLNKCIDNLVFDDHEGKIKDLNEIWNSNQIGWDISRWTSQTTELRDIGAPGLEIMVLLCRLYMFWSWPNREKRVGSVESIVSEAFPVSGATAAQSALNVKTSDKAPTEFMMFLGDFIYADVPHYFGDDQEAYRRLYRRNYDSPSFRKVYERLRMFSFVNMVKLNTYQLY